MNNDNEILVLYTDGGSKPSRGKGGYGFHGYLCTKEKPKTGAGAKSTPTTEGYIEGKAGKDKAATILGYVDMWASIKGTTTNNAAELHAAIEAYDYILEKKPSKAVVFLDSEYTRKGLSEWLAKWTANNWKKSDGNPVENKALWEMLLEVQDKVKAADIPVELKWVKGHSGDLGNSQADTLASRGVIMARNNIHERHLVESEAKGYWSAKVDINKMLVNTCWYFNTHAPDSYKSPDGRTIYHLGKHGDDSKLLGKRMSDVSFSVVYLKEPDEVLEKVRRHQDKLTEAGEQSVIIGRLDKLITPRHYLDIQRNGTAHLDRKDHTLDLYNAEKVLLTEECRPARLAYRAVTTLVELESLLEDYLNKRSSIVVTDITSSLYDVEEGKNDKVKCKLKKAIGTSLRYIDIDVDYKVNSEEGTEKIRLLLGMDLPSRNLLSGIADKVPKVSVITWEESPKSYRVATIVEADGDIGIWSSVFSNLKMLS